MTDSARPVSFDDGTAAELLVSLAAIADREWRSVFSGSEADLRLCPAALRKRVERFGRFGFLNLLGLAQGRTTRGLLTVVGRTEPEPLQLRLIGWQRTQLRELVAEETVRAALEGRPAALRAALTSGRTVLSVQPWLLRTPAAAVHAELLDVLAAWRELRFPPGVERALQREVSDLASDLEAGHDPRRPLLSIERAADGLRYDPPGEPREVVLCPVPAARPIVVVVDDLERHLICFAPDAPAPARDRLLEMARALGDDTRLQVLELLSAADLSAGEVSAAMGVPRTSLLHHLAILRAAGLLTTTVVDGRTVYRWRPDAVDTLHVVAKETLG